MLLKAWFANPWFVFADSNALVQSLRTFLGSREGVCELRRELLVLHCLTVNGAAAWAMTRIGDYLCVKSLQVPNMCPQLVGNLIHTPPSLGAANRHTETHWHRGAELFCLCKFS